MSVLCYLMTCDRNNNIRPISNMIKHLTVCNYTLQILNEVLLNFMMKKI